jgi:hypothetical protein
MGLNILIRRIAPRHRTGEERSQDHSGDCFERSLRRFRFARGAERIGDQRKVTIMLARFVGLFATLSLLVISCSTAELPGNSRASPGVQRDVLQMILILDGASGVNCDRHIVLKTEVVKTAIADDYTAIERWTIDRCGTIVPYRVTFRPGATGGTDFSVHLER